MDVRQDDASMATFFRSDRFFRINQHVYFQCRGNSTYGPFPDVKTANIMLSQFLAAKKQAQKRPVTNSYTPVENNEAYSLISETIEYDIFTPATKKVVLNKPVEALSAKVDITTKHTEATCPATKKSQKVTRKVRAITPASAQQPNSERNLSPTPAPAAVLTKPATIATKRTTFYQLEFSPVRLEEYVPGAEIGYLRVSDEDEETPFTYHVTDSRVEVVGSTLKLADNHFFDCEADSPVVLTVLARNSQNKRCRKTIRVEVEAIPS